jgi:hypothetical protein
MPLNFPFSIGCHETGSSKLKAIAVNSTTKLAMLSKKQMAEWSDTINLEPNSLHLESDRGNFEDG